METPGDRLKAARVAAGFLTAKAAAEFLHVPIATYTQHEKPHRFLPEKRARFYAEQFRSTPEWILYGLTPEREHTSQAVPVIGVTGVPSQGFTGDENGNGHARLLPKATWETQALAIAEGDPLGASFHGWIVYFGAQRSPRTKALHQQLCVVCHDHNQLTIARLVPSSFASRFHLLRTHGDPLLDQTVHWAALVLAITPP
jgi:hypothetical protein